MGMSSNVERWFNTDEAQDAVFSLEVTADHLAKTANDVRHWKWVIVALHNALQGFMVLALQGSDAFNVMAKTDKSSREWWEAVRRGDPKFPSAKMDYFMGLYKKIQDPRFMRMYVHSKTFSPSEMQTDSVEELNNLRKRFVHFMPKVWGIEVSGGPQLVEDCMGIIDFLVLTSGNILWHDESLESKANDLIEHIREQNEAIAEQYGAKLVRHQKAVRNTRNPFED
jgi:hypothetical protein